MSLYFRCKACDRPLDDEEVLYLEETDWLCTQCIEESLDNDIAQMQEYLREPVS